MKASVRLVFSLAVATGFSFAVAAQDLPAGAKVLAQTNTDVKFHPATVMKEALDGYTVKFEDGTVQDILQADMAFDETADPAKLKPDVKVAVNSFGNFYPGRIYEIGEDGNYTVAWESGGTDPVILEDLHIRMAPRTDPRPVPVAPAAAEPAPNASATAAQPAPASAPEVKAAPATPPPMAGSDEDSFLAAILGMAGDRFLMTHSQTAPVKSTTLAVKIELADITLDIPQDYVPVGLDFKTRNKPGKLLAIDWAKCYVTSFAGAKHAIYHMQYHALEDIPAVEKPSEVPAGAELSFSMRSRDGIVTTLHPAGYDANGILQPKWNEILGNRLFYGADLPNALTNSTSQGDQAKDLDSMCKNVIGRSFKIGIALMSGGGKTSVVEITVRIDDLRKTHEGNMLDTIGKQDAGVPNPGDPAPEPRPASRGRSEGRRMGESGGPALRSGLGLPAHHVRSAWKP
ncbi:MAG: hypothetical protein NT080_01735 [Spirochaetes bacterium]|nr:hypothetical protein [Spirochaetota bacterium]